MLRRKRWWFVAALMGCVVAVGWNAVGARASRTADDDDIPLVPLPPPPLSRPKTQEPSKTNAPPVLPLPQPNDSPRTNAPATPPPLPPRELPLPIPDANEKPNKPEKVEQAGVITARTLHQAAAERYKSIDSYIVRLHRREEVRGKMGAEEVILFKFRKEPWSVYLKWLGKEGAGREVLYVKGRHDGKIHTILAAGDVWLLPPGRRMAFAPDNAMVKSASRHSVTEAGIGASIDRIGVVLDAQDRGERKPGTLTLVGPVLRNEFDKPVYGVEHQMPPGWDATMPRGGKRTYYFDPRDRLPMLIVASDDKGKEVENYRFDRLQASVKLDDEDFNPDRLWGKQQ